MEDSIYSSDDIDHLIPSLNLKLSTAHNLISTIKITGASMFAYTTLFLNGGGTSINKAFVNPSIVNKLVSRPGKILGASLFVASQFIDVYSPEIYNNLSKVQQDQHSWSQLSSQQKENVETRALYSDKINFVHQSVNNSYFYGLTNVYDSIFSELKNINPNLQMNDDN